MWCHMSRWVCGNAWPLVNTCVLVLCMCLLWGVDARYGCLGYACVHEVLQCRVSSDCVYELVPC